MPQDPKKNKPIPVSDPKDPRLVAYNDSLNLYKASWNNYRSQQRANYDLELSYNQRSPYFHINNLQADDSPEAKRLYSLIQRTRYRIRPVAHGELKEGRYFTSSPIYKKPTHPYEYDNSFQKAPFRQANLNTNTEVPTPQGVPTQTVGIPKDNFVPYSAAGYPMVGGKSVPAGYTNQPGNQANKRNAEVPTFKGGGWLDKYPDGGTLPLQTVTPNDTIRTPDVLNRYRTSDGRTPAYVVHKRKTVFEPIPEQKGVLDYVDDVLSAPQKAAIYALTGKYQAPSEALGIKNKWGAMATDLILDPMNLLGVGIAKKLTTGAKVLEGANDTRKAAEAAKDVTNLGEKVFDATKFDVTNLGEKVFDATKFKEFKEMYKTIPLDKIDVDFTKFSKYKDIDDVKYAIKDLKLTNEQKLLKLSKTGAGVAIINDLITKSGKYTKKNVDIYTPHFIATSPALQNKKVPVNTNVVPKPAIKYQAVKKVPVSVVPTNVQTQPAASTPVKEEVKAIGTPERYWLGDRWGSYDDLIKANPSMKLPNVFYQAYHKRAPNDSTGLYTNQTIQKSNGGWLEKYK